VTEREELVRTANEITVAILNKPDNDQGALYDLLATLDRQELMVVAAGLAGLVLGAFDEWPHARERMIDRIRARIEIQ
jgi:hypothetical protein